MNREHMRTAIRCLSNWDRHYQPEVKRLKMSGWGLTDSCGTALCAAGYLTTCPAMNRKGFFKCEKSYAPRYLKYTAFKALDKFFDLSSQEIDRAFAPYVQAERPRDIAAILSSIMKEHDNAAHS